MCNSRAFFICYLHFLFSYASLDRLILTICCSNDVRACFSYQAVNSNQSNMLILQDCCTDKSCSLVIYAPVDVGAMGAVLNGGDPDIVLLLPSGFAILPDGNETASSQVFPIFNNNKVANNASMTTASSSGSLLTVAFQILVDHVPSAKLSLESVATVNNLISSTVCRIKSVVVKE